MKRESIQELKRELRRGWSNDRDLTVDVSEAYRVVAAGRPEALDPTHGVALGAAPTGAQGDYRLAVRLQSPDLVNSLEVARIITAARGEVDVAYVGPGFKQSSTRLQIGSSIGHPSITAGTLGAFVSVAGGNRILSNNHVLADEDRARPGDPVLHPGPADGGTAVVGYLERAVPLVVGPGNRMDAALATVEEKGITNEVPGLGPLAGVRELDGREPLAKVGRTTGLTRGHVVGLDLDGVTITYEKGAVTFDGVIELAGSAGAFTRGGDSGSLVVTDDPAPAAVALHFAGLSNGHSIAAPLGPILEEFQASLLH